MVHNFDELNNMETEYKTRAIPYRRYFEVMDFTEAELEERIEFAEEMEDIMLLVFSYIMTLERFPEFQSMASMDAKEMLRKKYKELIEKYFVLTDELEEYVDKISDEIIDTTYKYILVAYYLSLDRAMVIAENETLVVFNYDEFQQALADGKTMKEWVTKGDSRVRHTHAEVDGEMIPIYDLFSVGDSLMQYPKDSSLGASDEEIVNCRCRLKYY